MSKIISYIAVISVLLAFSCKSPEENPENPDLRVINGFTDSKLVYLAVNGQVFVDSTTPPLLPGDTTSYFKVWSGSLILNYIWVDINDSTIRDTFGRLYSTQQVEPLEPDNRYTLLLSGDKKDPTISLVRD